MPFLSLDHPYLFLQLATPGQVFLDLPKLVLRKGDLAIYPIFDILEALPTIAGEKVLVIFVKLPNS